MCGLMESDLDMKSWEHEEIMEGKIIVEGHLAPILTVS